MWGDGVFLAQLWQPVTFFRHFSKVDVKGNENVSDPLGRASTTLKTEDRETNERKGGEGKKWPGSKLGLGAKERGRENK